PRRRARRAGEGRGGAKRDARPPLQGVPPLQARRMGALPRRGHRLGARRVPRGPSVAMCGIAGIIYRDGGGAHQVGRDMTAMLQAMKHRGPDSTGYALYRAANDSYVMHVKLAEANGHRDFDFEQQLSRQRRDVEARVRELGAHIRAIEPATEHAMTMIFDHDGDLK